ncbi:MAG TPA: terminase small subunit [Myxococcota bacterium]|nr:terminase small subunit [Myxococcota bacterium]
MASGLTARQANFVNEYLIWFNATKAAKLAGYTGNNNTLAVTGYELLRNPKISEAISRRLSESAMSADEVLMRQAEIARSDIGEFLEQTEDGEVSIRLTDAKTNAPKRTHLIKRITQRKVVRTMKDMTETETTLTLELHDAQAAQVQLGKHHKLWTDRIEEKAEVEIKNINDITERLAGRIAGLATRIGAPTITGGDSTK